MKNVKSILKIVASLSLFTCSHAVFGVNTNCIETGNINYTQQIVEVKNSQEKSFSVEVKVAGHSAKEGSSAKISKDTGKVFNFDNLSPKPDPNEAVVVTFTNIDGQLKNDKSAASIDEKRIAVSNKTATVDVGFELYTYTVHYRISTSCADNNVKKFTVDVYSISVAGL